MRRMRKNRSQQKLNYGHNQVALWLVFIYLSVIYIILKSSSNAHFFLFFWFSFVFGVISTALNKIIHSPYFLGLWKSRCCQESRSIFFFSWAVAIETSDLLLQTTFTYTLSCSSSIDCCVHVSIFLYIDRTVRTKERIKGTQETTHIITGRTHSGVKFIWFQ